MDRDPRHVEAERLWRAIHTPAQIADRLGVSETTVRRWLDPNPDRWRIYDQRRRKFSCTACGAPLHKDAKADAICMACTRAARHERALLIERWWAEGRSVAAIGAEFGWARNRTTAELNVLRKQGYELPNRYRVRKRPQDKPSGAL